MPQARLGDAEEVCRGASWRGGWVRLILLLPVQGTSVPESVRERGESGKGSSSSQWNVGLGW
jgi:hypothetical protein